MSEAVTSVPATVPAVSGAGSIASMIGSLAVVLALIFALAWLARRMQGMRRSAGGLQVLAATAVGAKEKVVVLKVGDEHFLLGVGNGSVSLLHRYDGVPDLGKSDTTPLAQTPFAVKLKDMLQRGGK